MANNTINTRIKLKYDTLANWTSKNPTLLSGELAIVSIPTSSSEMQVTGTQPPQILFKVGPGSFNDLPYASAKAADVYGWAKAASKPIYDANEIKIPDGMLKDSTVGSVLNGHMAATNPHAVTAGQVGAYTKAEVDSKFGALVDNDTTYTFAKTTKGFTITPKGGTAQTISFEYLTQAEVEALTVAKAKGISRVQSGGGSGISYVLPVVDQTGAFVEGASGSANLGKGIVVSPSGSGKPTLTADISGNAATATKATQDGSGNNIVNTYATKEELTEAISEIDFPVDSVNGQKGTVTLSAGDVGAYTKAEVNSEISEVSQNLQGQIDDLDSDKVDKTTTVNGKALSGNISLDSTNILYGGSTTVSKFGGKNVHECLDMLYNDDSALAQRMTNVETVVNGTDADTMDSVAELINYVKNHGTEVTEMQNDIQANTDAIDVIEAKAAMGITTDDLANWNDANSKKHSHSNKTVLDGITSDKVTAWDSAATNNHTHSNKAILDATTASYLAAEKTKLSGIEAGAQVNKVESIRISLAGDATVDSTIASGKQANVILPVANTNDAGLMSAADYVKLAGIETGAEVNVIESISVNGVAATISNKAASVTIDGTKVAYGSNNISAASGKDITTAIDTVYSYVTSKKIVEYDNTRANYYIIDCGDASN